MYILLEVGCLECSIPTNVLSIHVDEEQARTAFEKENRQVTTPINDVSDEETTTAILISSDRQLQLQLHKF